MKYKEYSRFQKVNSNPRHNRGAVLVMALLIMSLVAALVVFMADSFELTGRRAEGRHSNAQSTLYISGAEVIASKVLREDNDQQVDSLDEDWASPQGLQYALEGDEYTVNGLQGILVDAQGRFNLNSLSGVAGNSAIEGPARRFTVEQRRFIRLLQTFEEPEILEAQAIEITEAIIDWVDSDDNEMGLGGAESLFYSDRGYSPPNGPMFSVSELMQIRHMTPEIYDVLRQVCVVLPEQMGINVNTALLPLMRTINVEKSLTPLTESEGQELIDERGESYKELTELMSTTLLTSLQTANDAISPDGLTVNSQYFVLHSDVRLNDRIARMDSLIRRKDGQTEVVWRSRGSL